MSGLPETAAALIDDFDLFDDWEDRYAYLIDLGKQLPAMPESERTDENKVRGCMSQVWFVQRAGGDRLVWQGDSDAVIVRGLIAVLQVLYGSVTRVDALQVDVEGVFDRLGLKNHLSMNRRNGFFSMVTRLRSYAGQSPA